MAEVAELSGRTVIVAGASSGFVAATARVLYAVGACPVLAARRAGRLVALSVEAATIDVVSHSRNQTIFPVQALCSERQQALSLGFNLFGVVWCLSCGGSGVGTVRVRRVRGRR
jgi:NAD(P)-dependent dehydrogenase (short-subunit alcohol dehydrogenase family)